MITMKCPQGERLALGPYCREVEADEQGSFVEKKSNHRWIGYAVEHSTNTLLAYAFGEEKHTKNRA